ncbi:MAG TPA: CPBP family intramembrane glutamic endopeptidase [Longimicrobiaceae bacterium]
MTHEPALHPAAEAETAPHPDDAFAAELRGFGPAGILTSLAVLAASTFWPLKGIAVLAWARASRTPLREIGFVRPRSWIGGLAIGIVFGGAFKLAMKAVVMPLLGADPVNHAYHYLAGNAAALPGIVIVILVGGAFGEEAFFRGFLFERLGRLFGSGAVARAGIVLITTAVFALAHYPDQGLAGVEQATFTGLVFGTIFAATGRLWMVMCAHAAFDFVAIALIYWNLEAGVAHLIF